jgi:Fic family protein
LATPSGPPYYGIDWDDDLEKPATNAELLVEAHLSIEIWLRQKASATILTLKVVEDMHRVLFAGLFPEFAGRLRGEPPQYVPCDVHFGNRIAVRYPDVVAECSSLLQTTAEFINRLDDLRNTLPSDEFAEEVLKVAAYLHCELVRIHPFRNGNGRLARTCSNYFAARYGFLPIPYERPKEDYIDAIRSWLNYRRIEHFMDFLRPVWQRDPAAFSPDSDHPSD